MSAPVLLRGVSLPVRASVGVTPLSATTDADRAIRLGDRVMYAQTHSSR